MLFEGSHRKFRLASCLAAVAGVAALLLSPGPTDAAWDGVQPVRLGDQVTAQFAGAPLTEVHRYPFFAPEGTVLAMVCVPGPSASGLVPDVRIYTEFDVPLDLGSTKVGNTVKDYRFAATGNYYAEVRAIAGTGAYRLSTKAKFPKVVRGATTTGTFAFDALAGTVLTAVVKPTKGSGATPTITGLAYRGGTVDLGSFAGTTKAAKLTLPQDATYTLAIDAGTAGGSVDVKVRLTPAKGRVWFLPEVGTVVGLEELHRAKWMTSPHADSKAMPFNEWNDANPPVVPKSCARCHTTTGYRDYIGADGTAAGTVESDAPIGQVITCAACHNDVTSTMTSVKFPSGRTVTGLGKEARCVVCHQGRESTSSVEAKIKTAAPGTDDDVMAGVGFVNIHYLAAGATLFGSAAMGGYEYADPAKADPAKYYAIEGTTLQPRLQYDFKFTHVGSRDTCVECHDAHSTEVKLNECATCHSNAAGEPVATLEDLRDIRMAATTNDHDGDGDKAEGVYHEIAGLRGVLLPAMQEYAATVIGTKIAYDEHSYPYFFVDTNGNGAADAAEAVSANRFALWSARLLRAAYNYQFSLKDPGAYAHNGKYVIELLYDSIADLNTRVPVPNFENLVRNDSTHFDSNASAWRRADGEDAIPNPPPANGRGTTTNTDMMVNTTCARCHSEAGFEFVVAGSVQTPALPAPRINGLSCESCHEEGAVFSTRDGNKPARRYVASVTFPYVESGTPTTGTPSTVVPSTQAQINAVTIFNGAKGTAAQDDSYVCMTCHRARESKLTVDAADPTGATATFSLSFRSAHYLGAGGTLYGSKAAVYYQYAGKGYAQRWDHDRAYGNPYPAASSARAQCSFCHMQEGSHEFGPRLTQTCKGCHLDVTTWDDFVPAFRAEDNFDNDATTKPKAEFQAFKARLLTAIQDYCRSATTAGVTGANWVVYDANRNPYFFTDANRNGVRDANETSAPRLDTKAFRATFNYNLAIHEPGAWAHNPRYIFQILYDSIEDMGGDLTGLTRP